MISNHFLCKDWVHHPIESQPFINSWPWGSRSKICGQKFPNLYHLESGSMAQRHSHFFSCFIIAPKTNRHFGSCGIDFYQSAGPLCAEVFLWFFFWTCDPPPQKRWLVGAQASGMIYLFIYIYILIIYIYVYIYI